MHNCSQCNFRYLRTPMGAVKVVNVAIGAISLVLVGVAYIPVWTLDVFLGTVTACLSLSLLYMVFYLLAGSAFIHSKANRVVSFIFHALAGTALIVAGIELIGWSEYTNPSCKHECPRLYTVGIAKTLTFMNGTLYLIVGFLGVKDDDLLDPESADEDIPLLNSTTVFSNMPGSIAGSKQALHQSNNHQQQFNNSHNYHYDNFFRYPTKVSSAYPHHQDDVRSSIASSYRSNKQYLRAHPPPPPNHIITTEYVFNNSYNSTASAYNGNNGTHNNSQHHQPNFGGGNGNNGGRRTRKISSGNNVMTTSATSAAHSYTDNNERLINELKHCDVSISDTDA